MATYRYRCPICDMTFDIVRPISECDDLTTCPTCKSEGIDKSNRMLGTPIFFGEKQQEPFYSIPLGRMVSGTNEMRRVAKERGMIEIGNDNIDKISDTADNDREAKSKARWAEFDKPIEING